MIGSDGSTGAKNALIKLTDYIRRKKAYVTVLSCIVVFITTYALILPAITLDQDEAEKQGGIDVPTQADDMQDLQAGPISFEGEGYAVTAECDPADLPADTEIVAEEISKKDKDYDALYEDALAAVRQESKSNITGFAFAKFYDITLFSGGEMIEPDNPIDITISYEKALKANDADNVRIVHFAVDEKTGKVKPEVLKQKQFEASIKNKKLTEATFAAESFSVYALVYTVDFEYDVDGQNYKYSINGESSISLAALLGELHVVRDDPGTDVNELQLFVDDIDDVAFSSPDLVRVDQDEEGAWILTSLKPFDSQETLTVTMKNGDVFTVNVTDAHEIPDSSADTVDVNKSYLICYEVDGTYYLLKNDGSVDSSHTPDTFENLNSTYCWTFNYVFEEKDLEETMTYVYYLIRPIDNKSKTIALNAEGEALVQRSNNNVAVVPAEDGGFHLIGYNEVKLNFEDGAFAAKEFPKGDNGIVVHIYEMDELPTYSYTARSADETRGTVTIDGGTPKTETLDNQSEIHLYEAESNSAKKNAGEITATPANHPDGQGVNKWVFDHWTQDGIALDRDQYSATIDVNTLPIPFNGSKLIAYFKQNPAYDVPDNEKEPSSIENLDNWLNELQEKHVPLDEGATTKTAEVYDYENRIYRVDIESKSNFKTFKGDVDMAFCMDVSNSMFFPSKLDEHTTLSIYQINWGWDNKNWLDRSRGWNNPYYLIADESNTATVFKIYYQDGNWKAQDASRETESDKSFVIGEDFRTNWTANQYDYDNNRNHPFNAGDNDNSSYTIYNAGDNGRNRFYYLNQALSSATTDLTSIKDILEVAGDESPDVRVAYNTFNKELGSQGQDFQPVEPITGIDLSNSHGGGTRPDQAFINAQSLDWQGDDKYVVLITDGAPQGGRDDGIGNDFNAISAYVKEQAQSLKDYGGVKFITIGLSMDKVPHGKKLLYDLADNDSNGNKMFFMAESASDLPNILRQVTKTIMDDAIVMADVTDTVGDAFYPVDKNTGLPLKAGDMIDTEGRLTTDADQAAGIVQEDGVTINWTNQAIDSTIGWHGTIYVKAKEDLLGGNGVKTNSDASIKATKYKMDEAEYSFDESLLGDKLQSLEIDFDSPRVNVNELSFPNENTEWTVYLGTEVDPEKQLKQMYEDILVSEVVNEDGSLYFPLEPNSISDKRSGSGTVQKFQLAGLILDMIKADNTLAAKYVQDGELDWDAFLADIQETGGVTVPYHPYGLEGDDSNIVIKLTKEIMQGEEGDLIHESPHDTTVVNNGNTPAEKYVLSVQYNPDYDHVLPSGQGGHGHYNYNTGSHGSMYQGHAAGRETSENIHAVNVYKKTIDVLKTDDSSQHTPLPGATFKLYKKDDKGATVDGLTGNYSEVATAVSGADGVAHLDNANSNILVEGETYYLMETSAPAHFEKVDTVWTVEVQTDKSGDYTNLDNEVIPTKVYPFNWDQKARIVVDGQPVEVIARGEGDDEPTTVNDGSFISNEEAISYRYSVVNRTNTVSLNVNKAWEDAGETPDSINFKIVRVSEKGHLWENGRVVPCTCTKDGVREYTCSECHETETYVISRTGHTPGTAHRENETKATCTEPGGYDMVVRCKVCDAIISSEHIDTDPLGHVPGEPKEENRVEAKCETEGSYDIVTRCTRCGEEITDLTDHHTIPALGHDWGEWVTTTPAQPGVAGEETRTCNRDPSHQETRAIDPLPYEQHRVNLVFRCIGDGHGGGSIYQTTWIADRSGTGVGDMTIQWDWNQYTTEQPFDVDGLYNGEYETHSWSPEGAEFQNDGSNKGGRETLTIHNITRDITVYITIRNNRFDGTNGNLIYQPTFSGSRGRSASPKSSAKALSKGGAKAGDGVKDGDSATGSTMTSEELSTYLDGLVSKENASCSDTAESHTYKEELPDTYTVTKQDGWTLNVSDLPKYDEYGNEYTYYVVEDDLGSGYETSYIGEGSGLVTINNRQLPGALTITKEVTVDGGAVPDSMKTVADGTYSFTITGPDNYSQTGSITVENGEATSTIVLENLKAGDYTIGETGSTNTNGILLAADQTVKVAPGSAASANIAAFTNDLETVTLKVNKDWADSGTHPAIQVRCVGKDAQGTIIETTDYVTLDGTESPAWQYTWDHLLKRKNDSVLTWSVEEKPIEGYADPVIVEVTGEHITQGVDVEYTIANMKSTVHGMKTDIEVQKKWDGEAGDTAKPAVTVQLQRAEVQTTDPYVMMTCNGQTRKTYVAQGGSISYVLYGKHQNRDYSVTATTGNLDGKVTITRESNVGNVERRTTITISNITENLEISIGTAVSNQTILSCSLGDYNPAANFDLTGLTDDSYQNVTGKTATLSNQNEWKYTFEDLNIRENINSDTFYVYRVVETTEVPGYAPVYMPDTGVQDGMIVVNNVSEAVTVEGDKTWVDGIAHHDNAADITLTLKRASKPVTDDSEWETVDATPIWEGNHYSFTNLPKNDDNNAEYQYKVEESVAITGKDYQQEADENGNFTNTELTNIEATKTWKQGGASINASITFASATFELQKKTGEDWIKVEQDGLTNPQVMSVAVTADANAWRAVWNSLPKYERNAETGDVTPIEYRVVETAATTFGNSCMPDENPAVAVVDGAANIENRLPAELTLVKVNAENMITPLKDAQFTLYKLDPDGYGTHLSGDAAVEILSTITGTDGVATVSDIEDGYYEIAETMVPLGYILTEDNVICYIKVENGVISLLAKDSETVVRQWQGRTIGQNESLEYDAATATLTVGNEPGPALPNSGGPGTTWIYLLGSMLLLGCGIALISRRRVKQG